MKPNEICGHEECGMPKKYHNSGLDCPVMKGNDIIIGFHPTNRFTPRKEGKAKGQSIGGGCYVIPADCPPSRLPFDLDKALKGAGLVTRDGRAAFDIIQTPNKLNFTAIVGKNRISYRNDGTWALDTRPSPLDLFLAGEEGKECCICGKPGDWTVRGEQLKTLCDSCVDEGRGVDLPKPETETQRQARECCGQPPEIEFNESEGWALVWCRKCKREIKHSTRADAIEAWRVETLCEPHTAPETQRQDQSEMEIDEPETLAELCARCDCPRGNHSFTLRCPLPEGTPFNPSTTGPFHASNRFKSKPAETKPRVVWVMLTSCGMAIQVSDKPFAESGHVMPPGCTQKQFIEASPEVISALKAAGIEIEKGTL